MSAVSLDNEALWLLSPRGCFEVRPALHRLPTAGEVQVRVRAVALNPVDAMTGPIRRIVTPWVRYPTVIGSDVAGVVTAVGDGVTRIRPGDRVLGFAAGQERARNSSQEGAFQRSVIVLERVCTRLPDDVTFEAAAVLPLALATAAAGLYEPDQLALPLPVPPPASGSAILATAASASPTGPMPSADESDGRNPVVLVWGASTSVGANAVQLARASGFTVFATAGRHNHDLVASLGATAVFDYRDDHVDDEVTEALRGRQLAGTVAIGQGSLTHALAITRRSDGDKRIASAYPDPLTKARGLLARLRGIHLSTIWGGTPLQSPVGPAIFGDFLTAALADHRLRPAPPAVVAGHALADIPAALEALRGGVSASKLVVTFS